MDAVRGGATLFPSYFGKDLLFCSAGVEVAAALVGKAKTVTVVDLVEAPFQLALGKEVGNTLKQVYLHAADDYYFDFVSLRLDKI